MTSVQGKSLPTYYYETFRIIGFPAIVKQHLTFGIGYDISKQFAINAGYTHAFQRADQGKWYDVRRPAGDP